MQQPHLNLEQITNLVIENKYSLDGKREFLSRCIDGRYQNSKDLPALAFPGADAGELGLLFATANSYGFEIDREKTKEVLFEVVGGVKNFQLHTDSHAGQNSILAGCGHIKQIGLDPDAYRLMKEDILFLMEASAKAKQNGACEQMLNGTHGEGAVLLIEGTYGVLPQCDLQINGRNIHVQVFEYHETLVNKRHRMIAKALIEKKAVILSEGCGEEYLYEALSEMSENHLMETIQRLGRGLPIYGITFDQKGRFEIEKMGEV